MQTQLFTNLALLLGKAVDGLFLSKRYKVVHPISKNKMNTGDWAGLSLQLMYFDNWRAEGGNFLIVTRDSLRHNFRTV